MPIGTFYGWAVCGKYLWKELSTMADMRYVAGPYGQENRDEYDRMMLHGKVADIKGKVDAPFLQAVPDVSFKPIVDCKGVPNIGYTFFEYPNLPEKSIKMAENNYDMLMAGSTWCEQVLNDFGFKRTIAVPQGVDFELFNRSHQEKKLFKDKFVVFSGGKFEYRKGQDIVIRAFKELQDKHDDVLLVCAWYNGWAKSVITMEQSKHINFMPVGDGFLEAIEKVLSDNGIDLDKVIILKPRPHYGMPLVYQNSDVGIFPNRIEGGTNLVLMEYMACGKPAIVTNVTGHADIVNHRNSIVIPVNGKDTILFQTGPQQWPSPDVDAAIEALEWAYQYTEDLKGLGDRGAKDLEQFTWKKAAGEFYAALSQV